MSILNFDGPSGRNFGKPLKVVLGIGALAAVVAVASTLAANININSGPVEFGQGVAQTTACSGETEIIVTPRSAFVNSESSTTFSFTGVSVSNIPEECLGVDFKISAYGESGGALELIGDCAYDGTAPVIRFDGEDSYQTSASAEDMDLDVFDRTESGFSLSWDDFTNAYGVPCVLPSAEDVYKVTVETSERVNYVSMPWSSVTWQGTTESGPAVYANSLTSGIPSWLDEVTTGGELTYSFSSNGMGILGDADEVTFPFVTDFVIPHDQKVRVEFAFGYYSRCDDQGVILYSESATPIWDWGQTVNGLIAQWDCGRPELGWPNGSSDSGPGGPESDPLENGSAYLGIIDYDPSLPDSNFRMTTKSYSGQLINTIFADQLLPAGEDYKIGFSADADIYEFVEFVDITVMSYFKNLKITIG